MEEIIARKYQMLHSEWNERQKRLWCAGEAIVLGYGGVSETRLSIDCSITFL
jgi:hypothetical protein